MVFLVLHLTSSFERGSNWMYVTPLFRGVRQSGDGFLYDSWPRAYLHRAVHVVGLFSPTHDRIEPGVGLEPCVWALLAAELTPGGVDSACHPSKVGKMSSIILIVSQPCFQEMKAAICSNRAVGLPSTSWWIELWPSAYLVRLLLNGQVKTILHGNGFTEYCIAECMSSCSQRTLSWIGEVSNLP